MCFTSSGFIFLFCHSFYEKNQNPGGLQISVYNYTALENIFVIGESRTTRGWSRS